jgi:hypothetical protein
MRLSRGRVEHAIPRTRDIAQPANNVPAEVASLAGVWESARGQVFASRLVVEEVHPEWASILYAWEDDSNGQFKAGWVRTRAKILPGGTPY